MSAEFICVKIKILCMSAESEERSLHKKVKEFDWKQMRCEISWMSRYMKPYVRRMALLTVLGTFSVLMGLAGTYISKELIDGVTLGSFTGAFGNITQVILLMVGFTAISLAANAFTSIYTARFRLDVTRSLKKDIFEAVIGAQWLELTERHSGDIVNRMTSDVDRTVSGMTGVVPALVVNGVRFIASFILMFYYDPVVAGLALIMGPMLLFSSRFFTSRLREYSLKSQQVFGENQSFIQEAVQNVLIIKTFSLKKKFSKDMQKLQDEVYDVSYSQTKFAVFSGIAIHVMAQAVYLLILGWCAYRLLNDGITVGTLVLFLNLAGKIQAPFSALVSMVPTVISATASAGRIMELFDLPRESDEDTPALPAEGGVGVKINGLTFGYKPDETVLESIDFNAAPGETVALVGPSGEGKTTLLRLLLGVVQAQQGEMQLYSSGGSIPVTPASRRYFSYVPQGNTAFSGTISQNLSIGKPDATEAEMRAALEDACILDFVDSLPDGLNSRLGEKGVGISEGQAQRLAIARALLQSAPILLLDEATSALDVETEERILRRLMNRRGSQTCILTTHRPSVSGLCHRVYRVAAKSAAQEAVV